MKELFWIWISLVGIASIYFYGTEAGFPGVSCRDNCFAINPLLLPGLCFQTALFPCNYDARVFHGASNGTCDGSYNCVCDYVNPNGDDTGSGGNGGLDSLLLRSCTADNYTLCHCQGNLTADIVDAYGQFCDFDCRCDHAAKNGTCDYERHQCICHYDTAHPWTKATCPEYSAGGLLDVSGLATTTVNLLYSFCNYTLPLINYKAVYCYYIGGN